MRIDRTHSCVARMASSRKRRKRPSSDAPPLENPGAEVLLRSKRSLQEPRSRSELASILKEAPNNPEANFELGLLDYDDKMYDQAIAHLTKASTLLRGRGDHRMLHTLGMAYLARYQQGEDDEFPRDLLAAKKNLTMSLKFNECSSNRDFRSALSFVYEAYGEMDQALEELTMAVSFDEDHHRNGFDSLKIADLSFHPDHKGSKHNSGLAYLEYAAVTAPPPEFTEAQLTFLCARCYQIIGRNDEGTQWMYYVFQTFVWPTLKNKETYKGKDLNEAFVQWGQDPMIWRERGKLYAKHNLNVFAVDAFSQGLQLAQEHSIGMWLEIGRACFKIRRVEPALQAVASALELDRCDITVRTLLRRWSKEWTDMLNNEEHLVTRIQSAYRGLVGRRLGRKRMKELRLRRAKRSHAATSIRLWFFYEKGRYKRKLFRAEEKEKNRKIRYMVTKITHRCLAMTYGTWKHMYETNKGVRLMIAKRCGKLEARCFGTWHAWVDERLSEKRALEAHRKAQEELVHKNLKKLFNRVLHQSWVSWHNFAQGSLRVKRKVKNAMLNRKRDLFGMWHANVWDAIEELQIKTEETVVIRSTMDDGNRRRKQQEKIKKLNQEELDSSPSRHSPSTSPARSPYLVGAGNRWKHDHKRGTAIMSALYRARSSGCAMIPGGIPIAEPELVKLFTCTSVVSQVAPFTRADARYAIAPILKTSTVLRSLLLYNCQIQDKGAMAIAHALAESQVSVLQTLGLGHNGIGVRGAEALAATLKVRHVNLTALYLEDNPKVGDAGVHALSIALEDNVRLEKLVLAKSKITDVGIRELVKSLRINDTLNSLSVQDNEITEVGARALGSVIGTDNLILRRLVLNGNPNISETGGIALAKAASRADGVLEDLEMKGCGIGDHTAEAFAEALNQERVETNTIKLQNVNLANNDIGGEKAKVLAMALNLKCPDCVIDLSGNPIDIDIQGFIQFLHFEKRIGSPRRSPRRVERAKQRLPVSRSPERDDITASPFSPDGFAYYAREGQKLKHVLAAPKVQEEDDGQ